MLTRALSLAAIATPLLAGIAATPAFALDVTKTATTTAKPSAVWKTIGDFCGIGDWHPAIASCTLSKDGAKTNRTLELKGGGTIVEQQVSRSEKHHRYTYKILSGPLPVANYVSTLSVTGTSTGSTLTWTGHFDAKGADDAKAEDVIGGIYDAGLKGIVAKSE